MKKLALLIFIIAITAGISICYATGNVGAARPWFSFTFGGVRGSGVTKIETRDLPKFTGIDFGGAIELDVTAQKAQKFEIEADDNIVPLITTEVKDGTLYISNQQKINWHSSPIKVRISIDDLESLNVSGASKATATGIKADTFKLDVSGASKVNLDGTANALNVETSGASNINAENLRSAKAKVSASGVSKVSVFATDSIDADASGASKISYAGSPKNVTKNASGASSVGGN